MSHKTTRTEKCIDRSDQSQPTNYCPYCKREFPPEEARSVRIRGPGEVIWSCPNCKRTSRGIAPEDVARPPVIEDLEVTVENGHTTAAIVFPNEARLQYRETEDGHIREEVISYTGEELESFSIGLQEEVSTFHAYAKSIKRYGELTEPELRREMPHVAAAVLDEHKR